jgi:hypothetical protein
MTRPNRVLHFESMAAIQEDARALLDRGYDRLGEWSLGQACAHLSSVMTACIDGFPQPPGAVKLPLWICRNTLARSRVGKAWLTRAVTGSIATFPQMVPPEAITDADGVARLEQSIAAIESHVGSFAESPSLGPLDRDDVTALHLEHASHHLGFLVPCEASN